MPACSSGTLPNVLPHRNAMPQTQDTTPHPVTVYRHGANLSLCYPLMWNVTLEYTATHFNVLGETRWGNPSPTFHTHQQTLNLMMSWWSTVGSSVESTVPTRSWTRDLWCANPLRYPLTHCDSISIANWGDAQYYDSMSLRLFNCKPNICILYYIFIEFTSVNRNDKPCTQGTRWL